MKVSEKKKFIVKGMPDEDTTKYIDYSLPLNFKQLLKTSGSSGKKKTLRKKVT